MDDKAKVRANDSSGKSLQLASYDAASPPDHDYHNVFSNMMGARSRRVLPSQYTSTTVGHLTSDKLAFNLLVSQCQHEGLGVLTDELPACAHSCSKRCATCCRQWMVATNFNYGAFHNVSWVV